LREFRRKFLKAELIPEYLLYGVIGMTDFNLAVPEGRKQLAKDINGDWRLDSRWDAEKPNDAFESRLGPLSS
jgi:hypothetical protein